MRQIFILTMALLAGGMILGLAASPAMAGPVPAVSAFDAAPSAIETKAKHPFAPIPWEPQAGLATARVHD